MSSSRRSSVSSMRRSSLAIPSKSAQTPSISIVHAEPERSSPPLGSAAARLSPRLSLQNIQERERAIAESQQGKGKQRSESLSEVHKSRKRSRMDSSNSSPSRIPTELGNESPPAKKSWFSLRRSPSNQSLIVPDIMQTANIPTLQVSTSDSPDVAERTSGALDLTENTLHTESPTESPMEIEKPEPPAVAADTPSAPSAPVPIKSRSDTTKQRATESPSQGWFGSFSKAQNLTRQEDLKPTAMIMDDRVSESSRSGKSSSSRSMWFTPQSPPRPQLEHVPSVPSSLDVKSPVQQNSPPTDNPIPQMELVSAHKAEAKMSALNPSTSRFTLSMPLLGRPKVPLDKALLETATQNTADSSSSASMPGPSFQPDFATPSNLSREPQMPDEQTPPAESKGTPSSSSSWWYYFRVGGTPDASPAIDSPGSVPSEPPVTPINDGEMQSPVDAPGSKDHPQETEVAGQATNHSNVNNECEGRALSVSEQRTGAVWYSPWAWYGWYTESAVSEASEDSKAPKTEAELVKEEALARPSLPEVSDSTTSPAHSESGGPPEQQAPPAEPEPSELRNPLLASFTTNTSGWASFFMKSRALTVQSITEQGEKVDGEMEVMDIDTDCNGPPSAQSHGNSAATAGDDKHGFSLSKNPSAKPSRAPSLKCSNGGTQSEEGHAVPLTTSEDVKSKAVEVPSDMRSASPSPSKKSAKSIPPQKSRAPNLVLPTFKDTFATLPRSVPPRQSRTSASGSTIRKTLNFVNNVLFAREHPPAEASKGKERMHHSALEDFGKELPRSWKVLDESQEMHALASYKNVVIIGIHGWFPGYAMRTVIGEPTGTSAKFANMMALAVEDFAEKNGNKFEQITKIPLEGEGKIQDRVDKLYNNLIKNEDWVSALHNADVIFIATHSQGSIASTHLVNRLIAEDHIHTAHSSGNAILNAAVRIASGSGGVSGSRFAGRRVQHVCCLALCGIHLGPLAYLQKNAFLKPYLQYFESEAAAELFEFQNTESRVSKDYVEALSFVLKHGVKFVYIASLNDQVVPVYSGAFTCVSHPLIMRALYIDGDAYHSSDFLSNLLVLLLRIRNAGLSDNGLLSHLSEATAGSLTGIGHSTAYEELATFSLAVEYLLLANDGFGGPHELISEPFDARDALNDYEIPWALRDLIADERVAHLFSKEFSDLRDAFNDWHPRTTILRDLKRKLEPIRRLKLSSRL